VQERIFVIQAIYMFTRQGFTILIALLFTANAFIIFYCWLRIMQVTWKYRRKSFTDSQSLTATEQRTVKGFRKKMIIFLGIFVFLIFILYLLRFYYGSGD
jgi:hypothetical protein